jgi:poly [ADP-ribose] polymerase 2/3/4
MSNIVEHRKFVCVNFGDSNNNKAWNITLHDNGDVLVEYARVGQTLKPHLHPSAGKKKFDSLIRSKTNPKNKPDKLYTENLTIASQGAKTVSSGQLHNIAKKQIKTTSPLVQQLIDFCVQVNAHQIAGISGGSIQYVDGQFQTPQGIIIPSQVQEARTLLDKMVNAVVSDSWANTDLTYLNGYLRLIPHAVGMKKITPERIFPNKDSLKKENDLLTGLESSFIDAQNQPDDKKIDEPKIFEVEIEVLQDNKEWDRIKAYYEKTKKRMHSSSRYKLKKVYTVKIASESKPFEQISQQIGNIKQLFHGTSCSNVLSILKQGLVIPPSSSPHVTGRLAGNGVYGSDISSKALNYATNFWGNKGNTSRIFMFLCNFSMGKIT